MPAVKNATPRARKSSNKPVRFKSVGETNGGTNEEHIETLLGELPWMRMGILLLNSNDRELEAKIAGADLEHQFAFCELADAMVAIRDRYQAGIDVCNAVRARIIVVMQRIQVEAGVSQ